MEDTTDYKSLWEYTLNTKEDLKAENEDLKAQVEELKKKLATAENDLEEARTNVHVLETLNDRAMQKKAVLEAELRGMKFVITGGPEH